MEVEDVDPPWTARERVFIDKMEQYLEKRESIQVEVTELKQLLRPEDADVCIETFVESARDEGGCKKALLDDEGKGRGTEVADAVLSMEQIIFGLQTMERSSVSRKRPTPSIHS